MLEQWLRSYKPDELFDDRARRAVLRALCQSRARGMGSTPHANGGLLLKDLNLPDARKYASKVTRPGRRSGRVDPAAGRLPAGPVQAQRRAAELPPVGPDETASNRLDAVFEATQRTWWSASPTTCHLATDGRVMEVLSEHQCQGWLEGYLLTGRHGLFNCYEAFIHIVDSMFNQHAKWLEATQAHPLAAQRRLAQHPAVFACLAPGSQRLLASGSGVHRCRLQQESRCGSCLSAAGRQHVVVCCRPHACAAAIW